MITLEVKNVNVYPCGCIYAETVPAPAWPNEEGHPFVAEVSACEEHSFVEDYA